MKKYSYLLLVFSCVIIFLISGTMWVNIQHPNADLLNFWSGIIGSVIGVAGAVWVMRNEQQNSVNRQLDQNKKTLNDKIRKNRQLYLKESVIYIRKAQLFNAKYNGQSNLAQNDEKDEDFLETFIQKQKVQMTMYDLIYLIKSIEEIDKSENAINESENAIKKIEAANVSVDNLAEAIDPTPLAVAESDIAKKLGLETQKNKKE